MISGPAADRLKLYLAELAATPVSVTSVTDPDRAWEVHVLDSLEGLRVDRLARALEIGDIGSGGGFPGVPLAAVRDEATVDLIESVRRKCEFMSHAVSRAGIANASVINERAEEYADGAGRERYDAVTVRAVGRLTELAELASPLLRTGGSLVAWKGAREPEQEAELDEAAEALAMSPVEILPSRPYPDAGRRHLYVIEKTGDTPDSLPRRPGMARKRPLGRRRGARPDDGPAG